jgi:hypothetical protein
MRANYSLWAQNTFNNTNTIKFFALLFFKKSGRRVWDEKSQVIAEQSQHQNLRVSSSKKTDTNFAIKKYFPIKSNKSNEALLMFAAKKAGEI